MDGCPSKDAVTLAAAAVLLVFGEYFYYNTKVATLHIPNSGYPNMVSGDAGGLGDDAFGWLDDEAFPNGSHAGIGA